MSATKHYDAAYFSKWYRDPRYRLITPKSLARKVAMVVAIAEWHLGGPLRSVVDIGCGEASWRAPLLKLRPKLDYVGLEASDYAVARFGRQRNIHKMRFGELANQHFNQSVDLVLCVDVMHYLPDGELISGLATLAGLTHGMSYLEVMTQADHVEGDQMDFQSRSAQWYREQFAKVGLHACGQHCYLPADVFGHTAALARADLSGKLS